MKWNNVRFLYSVLIGLCAGCTGLKSKICTDACCTATLSNDEIKPPMLWESDGSLPGETNYKALGCTLMGAELANRKEALQKEIFAQIRMVEEIETGYTFSFAYDEAFLIKMTDYVIAENNCCPFFTFETRLQAKNDVLLRITGPPEAKKLIEVFLAEL